MVSLQVCLLAIDDLWAVVFSTFHDEELISIFSFLDDFLSNFVLFLRHGFDQDLLIFWINILEEDRVSDEGLDEQSGLLIFWDLDQLNSFFFIEVTKHFFRNGHSAPRLPLSLLFLDERL